MKLVWLILLGVNFHNLYGMLKAEARAKAAGVSLPLQFRAVGWLLKILCAGVSAFFIWRILQGD